MKLLASFANLLIRFYQIFISPFLPRSCRFSPTCSCYGRQALKKHGFIKGVFLTTFRIIKCNPYVRGGIDEVPDKFSFTNSYNKNKDLILRKFKKNGKSYIKR